MNPTLHLSRDTPQEVTDAVIEAIYGVRITEETHAAATRLATASQIAEREGMEHKKTALSFLARNGFRDAPRVVHKKHGTAKREINEYISKRRPDVAALYMFQQSGLGEVLNPSLLDGPEVITFPVLPGCGQTKTERKAKQLLSAQGVVEKIPPAVLSRISGLYWRSPAQPYLAAG